MDGPQPQNNSVDIINSNNDYISNLPAVLKEIILIKLSIKEAVRTSIFSSKWKDSWTSIPILVFYGDKGCEVPSCFFSCSALKSMDLSRCIINVPRFFNGFALLHTLQLHNFDLSGSGIDKLVSSCPLLDSLSLSYFRQPTCINISAPNLTYLYICGEFYDLCLETPKLTIANIELKTDNGDCPKFNAAKDGKESNITRTLGRLSSIQELEICGAFSTYLARGPTLEKLPTIFNHLKEVHLDIWFSKQNEDAALCLFQCAPNIQVLNIQFCNNEVKDEVHVQALWELKAMEEGLFKRLETVNMAYHHMAYHKLSFWSTKSMLQFAKFVLRTAPTLEKLTIMGVDEFFSFLYFEVKSFPKLSTKAEIVFPEEYESDFSF